MGPLKYDLEKMFHTGQLNGSDQNLKVLLQIHVVLF